MKTLKLYLEQVDSPAGDTQVLLQLAENVAHEAVAAVIAEKQRMVKPGRMAEMDDAMREDEWEFYRRFFNDVRTAYDDWTIDTDGDYEDYCRMIDQLIDKAEKERLSMVQTHNRLRDRLAKRESKRKFEPSLFAEEEGQKKARAE